MTEIIIKLSQKILLKKMSGSKRLDDIENKKEEFLTNNVRTCSTVI